jgi:hypothetical protein
MITIPTNKSIYISDEMGIGLWFTPKGDKPLNQLFAGGLDGLNKPNKPLNHVEARKFLLDWYRKKQSFRVSIGKSTWTPYETGKFNEKYNQREILNDEIVIEFDTDDLEIVCNAINQTGLNLLKAGIEFEYWEHGGKSPHLHIHDLPISEFDTNKRTLFKKMFLKRYIPKEYFQFVDMNLTGIHLIALEWAEHWKGNYGIKKLISIFKEKESNKEVQLRTDKCSKCDSEAQFFNKKCRLCKQCFYEVFQ